MSEITVDEVDLRAVMDVAIGSCGFSSGFLDHAEVEVLRRMASTLGMNPMDATPYNFAKQYEHPFRSNGIQANGKPTKICLDCGLGPKTGLHPADLRIDAT